MTADEQHPDPVCSAATAATVDKLDETSSWTSWTRPTAAILANSSKTFHCCQVSCCIKCCQLLGTTSLKTISRRSSPGLIHNTDKLLLLGLVTLPPQAQPVPMCHPPHSHACVSMTRQHPSQTSTPGCCTSQMKEEIVTNAADEQTSTVYSHFTASADLQS
jgi:hypothetical protein